MYIGKGVELASEQRSSSATEPIKASSFIRHQQREEWEALKGWMGPIPLTSWYQFTPGSILPAKKVYVLQGTKGYNVEQVVCLDREVENEGARGLTVVGGEVDRVPGEGKFLRELVRVGPEGVTRVKVL